MNEYTEGYSVTYKTCLQCGLIIDLEVEGCNVGGLDVIFEEEPNR